MGLTELIIIHITVLLFAGIMERITMVPVISEAVTTEAIIMSRVIIP